jgi:hypothetical protein
MISPIFPLDALPSFICDELISIFCLL